ncbi:MAG: matrixin family metalloprotease [Gemmatimonadetes bacterium]|nr:matrixin family metalloprotease [Gemmatimonadota bacterium]
MRRIWVLAVACFGLALVVAQSRRSIRLAQAVTEDRALGADTVSQSAGVVRLDSLRRVRERNLRRITESNTYLPAMLVQGDSVLKRWSDHMDPPLRVYFPDTGPVGYVPAMREAVRDAFRNWERVGDIPVTFIFTSDSAGAEVQVRWIREFAIDRTGQADVRWNRAGWLISGTLTLAVQNPGGNPLPPEAVHTVALHEIGHLLGLGHSDHAADVMYPTTQVHEDLTPRDRASARLLYELIPGSMRLP